MSKAFIAAVLQDSMESTGVAANKAADDLLEAIVSEIEKTGTFTLPGFGTFRVADRAARTALNPRTLEPVQVPAGRTVRFKASPVLKARVTPVVTKKAKATPGKPARAAASRAGTKASAHPASPKAPRGRKKATGKEG